MAQDSERVAFAGRDVHIAVKEGRPVAVAALAHASGWPCSTIYDSIKRGEIEVVRIGSAMRVKPSSARRLLGIEEERAA